jgi:formamidopyrimidine-DNA glycosylase
MPELPEMQALAERLQDFVGGSRLTGIDPLQFSALKTFDPAPDALSGRVLERVGRRGKFITMDFGGPRVLVHLSQGGRVDVEQPPKRTTPKNGVVRFRFDAAPSVLVKEFGTERKAGIWLLPPDTDGPLQKLGPEPSSREFAELIVSGKDKRRIHTMLREQRTVAGIGRGYTDDILHAAQLSPYATLEKLSPEARRTLLEAIESTLRAGLEVERRRKGGLPPKVGDHWIVHGRYGQPCPRCSSELKRVYYESHEVAYCPQCQTDGKILADRRLSRLLR